MLRIETPAWDTLNQHLLGRVDVETAGIILAEPMTRGGGVLLRAREAFALPDEAYGVRTGNRIEIDPVALNRLTRPARERRWSVITVHSHPMSKVASFSNADDQGDHAFMPALGRQIPAVPHGSIVVTPNGQAAGRMFMPKDGYMTPSTMPVSVVGESLKRPTGSLTSSNETWFVRQVLALGEDGQNALRSVRMGVVGAGGTGSACAVQLAHLGVGDLVVVDDDIVASSNVSRIIGCQARDVGRPKAHVIRRYVSRLSVGTTVTCVVKAIRNPSDADAVRDCDLVVCCVDSETPRAILNRVAYEWLMPVVDMGTAFRVDERGTVVGDAGRVVTIGPGRPCLACWGDLDPEALRIETLAPEDRQRQQEDGYIEGAAIAAPSVVAFNSMVASAAVVEVLRLVAGFGEADPPSRLAFQFRRAVMGRNSMIGRRACTICNPATQKAPTAAHAEPETPR